MVTAASESARAARAARRRLVLADFVRRAGAWLLWGTTAAAALVGADRLGLSIAPWPLLLGAPLGAALALSVVVSILRRPSLAESAAQLDRALGLRDRVSTALKIKHDDPFSLWAREDGERAAREADPTKTSPVQADWTWGTWPVAITACAAVALYVPSWNWERGRERPASAAERAVVADRLAAAAEAAQAAVDDPATREASHEDLAAISDLEAQLRSGDVSAEQALARTDQRLQTMASDLERSAESTQRATDAVRDRLVSAGAHRPKREDPGPSSSFQEALSRGDLTAADAAARDLAERADSLSEGERLELANDLEEIAESLKDAEPPPTSAATQDVVREALKSQGVPPETAEELSHEPDPERVRQELQKRGMSPEGAQRAAGQADEARQKQDAQEDARDQVKDLREALEDAAELVRKPPAPEKPESAPADPPKKSEAPQEGNPPSQEQTPRTGDGKREPSNRGPERQGQPRDTKGEQQPKDGAHKTQPGESQPSGQPPKSGEPDSKEGSPRQSPESPAHPGGEPPAAPGSQQEKQGADQKDGQSPGTPQPASDAKNPTAPQDGKQEQPEGKEEPEKGREGQPGEGNKKQPGDGGKGQPQRGKEQPREGPKEQSEKRRRGEPGEEDNKQSEEGRQSQPGEGNKKQPGQEFRPGGDQQGPPQGERGLKGLQRRLQDLARGQEAAREMEQRAERLRDAARELGREPQEGGRGERRGGWERGLGDSGLPSAPTSRPTHPVDAADDPVDARRTAPVGDAPRERVISEWYNSDRARPEGQTDSSMVTDLRTAVRGAERAVEQQSVPARHSDLVRRVFRRYAERASPGKP